MRSLKWIAAAALAAYFCYFAAGGLRAAFAPDDMMNLGSYLRRGFWPTVADNLMFWSTAYRPFGGLFYLPLYALFGLNPFPYRLADIALIALNTALTYHVARLVSGSRAAAVLAAVIVTAHAGMADLYYNTSSIYDVLAYAFTLLLLALYLSIRTQARVPGGRQLVLLAAIFICGLNSKEITVVAAGFVAAYELFLAKQRDWRAPALLCSIGLLYAAGKLLLPNSIAATPGYHLEFSLARYVTNNVSYLNVLLGREVVRGARELALLALILTAACCWSRPLRWCWWLIVTATLPISFIPIRGGGSLYVPLLGWALLAAVLAGMVRPPQARAALSAVVALAIAAGTIPRWRGESLVLLASQRLTSETIRQVQALHVNPAPKSRVLFIDDPFEDWDMLFIAQLVWRDPTIDVTLSRKLPERPGPEELQSFDYVLAFRDGELRMETRP